MAVTPRVYLHRVSNKPQGERKSPDDDNSDSVPARQREMAVDEQNLEPILPNQDPPSLAQPFPTIRGEIVK